MINISFRSKPPRHQWRGEEPQARQWHVIVRREVDTPTEIKYSLSNAAADTTAYRELARATLKAETCRALPALSQGRLLVRSTENGQGKLMCIRVGE